MRTMVALAVMTTLAGLAVPAGAQTGALPSVTRVQYGVTYGPCVEKPMPQPDGSIERSPIDEGCGREPVEPPVVQPVPQPEPKPDPCWWDDCPRGGGLIERYRIQKETFRGGDLSGKVAALNALFDNMTAKAAGGGVVQGVASSAQPMVPKTVLSKSSGAAAGARRRGVAVPVPWASLRDAPRVILASDTDANPLEHDGAAMGAVSGAIVGAGGGVWGAAAGLVGGALAGSYQDLKDKAAKDEKSYEDGKRAWENDHRRSRDDE